MSSDPPRTPSTAPNTLEEEFERIEREQEEVVDFESRERRLDELNAQARELAAELRITRVARRRRSAEAALPIILPRTPCAKVWDEMKGGARVRACAQCKARVYDLGGLETTDALRLLRDHEGDVPSHMMGRVDGTVTAEACGEKRRAFSPVVVGAMGAGAMALLSTGAALGYSLADDPPLLLREVAQPHVKPNKPVKVTRAEADKRASGTALQQYRQQRSTPDADRGDREGRRHGQRRLEPQLRPRTAPAPKPKEPPRDLFERRRRGDRSDAPLNFFFGKDCDS